MYGHCHITKIAVDIVEGFADINYSSTKDESKDILFEHSKQLLSLGLLYQCFRDAIKECDGIRVR